MSNVEDVRKQLAEHNIARLSEFRNGIIAKIDELKGDGNAETKKKLTEAIAELEDVKIDSSAAKELVDTKLAKLKKELEVLESPNTVESLKNTQSLVERRIAEIQVLGC